MPFFPTRFFQPMAKVNFSVITSTSASVQSFALAGNWTNTAASIQMIGPGGAGAAGVVNNGSGGGGGAGGGYAKRGNTIALDWVAGETIYFMQNTTGDSWMNPVNLLLQSTAMSSSWSNTNCTITTGQTDPAAGTNAVALIPTITNAAHPAFQTVSKINSTAIPMTFSVTAKANGYNFVELNVNDTSTNAVNAWFNLTNVAWSVTNVNGFVVLSNGNLTATAGNSITANQNAMGRCDTAITTGSKVYYEMTDVLDVGQSIGIGVCNSSQTFTNGDWLGAAATGIGYYGDGTVHMNFNGTGVALTTLATFTTGDVIGVAVDYSNARIWFRVNAGNWNNDPTANPATNTNGIDISSLTAGPLNLFPAYTVFYNGSSFGKSTTDFGTTTFAHAAPSGFVGLTGTVSTAASVGAGTFTNPSAGITALGSGWFRCWVSATTNTAASLTAQILPCSTNGSNSFAGDTTSGIFAYQPQLNHRAAVPGTFFATTSSAPLYSVLANAGPAGSGATAGTAGTTGQGDTVNNGGNGGAGASHSSGGGGGGAAGNIGAGKNGGTSASGFGGGGGGGANGGTSSAGSNASSATGAAGGNGHNGTGGGAAPGIGFNAGNNATANSGGGASGATTDGFGNNYPGANGAFDQTFDTTHGAGGAGSGGGGSSSTFFSSPTTGGAGALYGGGGGGGGYQAFTSGGTHTGGAGGAGLIWLIYTTS